MAVNRREFLKKSGAAGAVLALGFSLPVVGKSSGEIVQLSADEGLTSLNPFVMINSLGKVTIVSHKPEIGTGVYQALPALVAEELDVPLENVQVVQGEGHAKYGNQDVGGSNSVRGSWKELRRVGAAAREMLVMAAAAKWGVEAATCRTENGFVLNEKGEKLGYGDLVAAASKLKAPKEPKLKEKADFKILGQNNPKPDIPLKVNGSAVFGLDMKVPGMVYAVVERAPAIFRGKVKSYNEQAALAVPGVKRVLKCERQIFARKQEGVAVIADSYWAALQGRKALNVQWENEGELISTASLYAKFRELGKGEGVVDKNQGDFDGAFAQAVTQIEAEYEMPFVAHSPMEPQNAIVQVKKEGSDVVGCEVWASTQVPTWLRDDLPKYLKIRDEALKINVPFVGGGFGRRLFHDFIMEAAYLSREVDAPVKVVWTREDDTLHGPFRPGTFSVLKGGLDKAGKPVAFQHKVVAPSIDAVMFGSDMAGKVDNGAMEGVSEAAYTIPNFRTNYIYAPCDIPMGWWRAVYSTTTCFAHESFMDEMAAKAKQNPMDFRLALLNDAPRIKNILQTLREKSAWDKPLPKGWGRGVAVWHFFAGMCGHVVEVSSSKAGIKVERVVAVIECGMTVNPDGVKAQTEGNIVMGLTAAIKNAITFQNGVAQEANFDKYPMLRIHEVPKIEVHVLEDGGKVEGAGEPGLPPVAPALANAIFNATGKRIRKLPFDLATV